MAEAGFWVAWGIPARGRERQALDLFKHTTTDYLDGLGEALVYPGIDDPDLVGDQLNLGDPQAKVVVTAEGVDLRLGALNQDEATQFRALRFEDRRIEALDPSVLH